MTPEEEFILEVITSRIFIEVIFTLKFREFTHDTRRI
jgi:hypothetical protein